MPLVQSDVEELSSDVFEKEFHSFLAKLRASGGSASVSYEITIPAPIVRALRLKEGTILEVAIRVADEKTIEEYGGLPDRQKSGPPCKATRHICPVCEKPGVVVVREQYNRVFIYVRHAKADGFDRPTVHYVSMKDHFDFYRAFVPEDILESLGKRRVKAPRHICPVCGKPGVVRKKSEYGRTVLYVKHVKADGFEKPVEHYVSKKKYPEFYKAMLQDLSTPEEASNGAVEHFMSGEEHRCGFDVIFGGLAKEGSGDCKTSPSQGLKRTGA